MRLSTVLLVFAILGGVATGQTSTVIDSTRKTLNAVQQQKTDDSNRALSTDANPTASPAVRHAAVKNAALVSSSKSSSPQPAPATAKTMTAGKATVHKTSAKAEVLHKLKTMQAPAGPVDVADKKNPDSPKAESKKPINITGRRDPFISPVVNRASGGSGCSNGKRCLAIDQIALRGVVRADAGMIAVVVNGINKAYFLRENDPVFNGYVVRITGDSIIFKETLQDKLGKPFVREVTKKITTPAV